MSATPGFSGNAKIGSNIIAQVQSYNFDLNRAMEDVTVMKASPTGSKQFLPTVYDMGFSIKALWDLSDTTGQLAMQNAWINATLLTFTLTPNGGTNTYVFSAYVAKIAIVDDVEKVTTVDYTLQPTGDLTTT